MFKSIFNDKVFLRRVISVAIPIMVQMAITNFVSLLDNLMVGQVGQIPMSGVSIVNQLLFVFNLCIFGATSGAGIFTAQLHGSQNHEGIRHTFRFKILISLILTILGVGIFLQWSDPLISLYLTGDGDISDATAVLTYGRSYLQMMLFGLLGFGLSTAYSSTLRETGQTAVPMIAGIVAVVVNLGLNYILIFGHFGAPAMGVQGAALATVISRYVELAVVAGWTHLHSAQHPFIRGAYRSVYIPKKLLFSIVRKGSPILLNEFFWSSGMAVLSQCYSTCGLDVVPAMNISTTIYNLGSVAFLSMGNSVGIIMGQLLGAGTPRQEIMENNRKLTTISALCGTFFGIIMIATSGLFPALYKATDEVRRLASLLICASALVMPFSAIAHAAYFTLRSGGKTIITVIFDSGFMWCISVPLAFVLSRFVGMPILPLYALCQSLDIVKCVLGSVMVRKGSWIQNLAE